MQFIFRADALKQFKKLQPEIQKRVIAKLEFFSKQEEPLSFAKPLIDKTIGQYRFRIGDYRVIVDLEEERLKILHVGHRKDIYR